MSRASINILDSEPLAPNYTNAGLPTKTDLSSTSWNKVTLELSATSGSTAPLQGKEIIVKYAFSDTSIDAEVAPSQIIPDGTLTVVTNSYPNTTWSNTSEQIEVGGDFLYTWIVTKDSFGTAVAITLDVVQVDGDGGGGDFLPLAGGTMSGDIIIPAETTIFFQENGDPRLQIYFSDNTSRLYGQASTLQVYGENGISMSADTDAIYITTNNGNNINIYSDEDINLSSNNGNTDISSAGKIGIHSENGVIDITTSNTNNITITADGGITLTTNSGDGLNLTTNNGGALNLTSDDSLNLDASNAAINLTSKNLLQLYCIEEGISLIAPSDITINGGGALVLTVGNDLLINGDPGYTGNIDVSNAVTLQVSKGIIIGFA